jgi:hypothetical protein
MGNQEVTEPKGHSVDFLLAEYQNHRESFWRSEELGERRVNFFITIATAVLAALAIREEGIGAGGQVDPIFFYGLGALLLFGVVTLMRLIRRNLVSHEHARAMGRIRRYFADRDEEILRHLYFEPRDDWPYRKKEWNQIFSLGTGGLVETVSLVNNLIVAALCALLAVSLSGWIIGGLLGLVGFIGAWIVQFIYVKWRYDKERPTADEIRFPGN